MAEVSEVTLLRALAAGALLAGLCALAVMAAVFVIAVFVVWLGDRRPPWL